MAEPIGALRAELSANAAQFTTDMHKARDAVKNSGSSMATVMDRVKNSFNGTVGGITKMQGALAGLGVILSAGVILNGVKNIISAMDKLDETSEKVGVGVEALQVFQLAAQLSGIEADSLTKGLGKLSKNMYEGSDAFDKIGVSTKDANGDLKLTDAVLLEMADKFKDMPDGTMKTALAMKVFGKSGAELIPMLNMGSAGIQQLREEMGYLFTGEDASRAAAFKDRLEINSRVIEGMKMQIISGALPALTQIGEAFKKSGGDGDYFRTMGEGLGNTLKWVAGTAYLLSAGVQTIGVKIANLVEKAKRNWSAESLKAAMNRKLGDKDPNADLDNLSDSSIDAIWKNYENKLAVLSKPVAIPKPRKRGGGTGDDSSEKSAADARLKRGEQTIMQLERESNAIGEVTRADKMRWETTQGQYKDLNAGQKERLIALSQELDTLDSIKRFANEMAEDRKKDNERLSSINKENDALREQAAIFTMTEREATLYKMTMKGATEEQLNMADSLLMNIEQQKQMKNILEEIKTPYDVISEKIATANGLLVAGQLSIEEYTLYMGKLMQDMKKVGDNGANSFKYLTDAIDGWGKKSAAAITRFAQDGAGSFSEMAASILSDIAEMMIYENVTGPLFKAISGAVGGLFTGASASPSGGGSYSSTGSYSFLGGRASGGPVSSGAMYEVNEKGAPELLNVGNRQFLMMGQNNGYVAAANAASAGGGNSGSKGGGGDTIIYNINAIDAKSFDERLKQSSGTLNGITGKGLKHNTSLRNDIRKTVR